MRRRYPALIHKDADSDYGVSFPDFPGCVTAGASPEEAHELAIEALQFHVQGMVDDGEHIPEPSRGPDLFTQAVESGGVLTFVPVQLPARAKRINVTMHAGLLEDVDKAADAWGLSRSAFLAEGARRMLDDAK